ncbi:MAG: hypothetical protein AAGE13_08980 [Pseudomonadota bacterium]
MPVDGSATGAILGDAAAAEAPRLTRDHTALAAAAAKAGGMDESFRNASRALRLLLHIDNGGWAERFLAAAESSTPGAVTPAEKARLWGHLAHHARLTAAGRFGPDLAASSERIALLLGAAGMSLFDATGLWSQVQMHLVRTILTDDRMSNRLVRRDAYASLGAWILSEAALSSHFITNAAPRRASV